MRSRRGDSEATAAEILARLQGMRRPIDERQFVPTSATLPPAAPGGHGAPAWVAEEPERRPGGESGADAGGWVPRHGPSPMGDPGRHQREKPRLLTIPASLQLARVRPSVQSVLGMVIVVVLVAVVFGAKAASAARDTSLALDTASEGRGAASGAPTVGHSGAAANASAAPGAGSSARVVVHVAGAVTKPGVVRLPGGSRVADALKAAGGATRKADLDGVNLARVLLDGEQILVPVEGQAPAAGGSSAASGGTAQTLSLNSASAAELEELPGIGPVIAGRIVEWRTTNGGFTSVDDLTQVRGIGEAMLADLRPLVRP